MCDNLECYSDYVFIGYYENSMHLLHTCEPDGIELFVFGKSPEDVFLEKLILKHVCPVKNYV